MPLGAFPVLGQGLCSPPEGYRFQVAGAGRQVFLPDTVGERIVDLVPQLQALYQGGERVVIVR